VLPDADLKRVVKKAAEARLQNTGQSCIAAKRFIIPSKTEGDFIETLQQELSNYPFGDPLEPSTALGPLARLDLAVQLSQQVQQAQNENTLVATLKSCPNQGAFAPVQLLSHQRPGSIGRTAEFFGPVFSLLTYEHESEIVSLANETTFGLGASVWSSDTEKAITLANQLECGNVFINDLVKSDARWPFGGNKNSGFGKELGPEGIQEFSDLKIIAVPRK
jgi:succinate-semialdehyde dehydrogenase/glutarate-semialdehyde dehydrogenase